MAMNPILLFVWAVLAACFLALLVYRGQLTRYENDRLFLNEDSEALDQKMHTDIVRKIGKIQPLVRILGGAAGLVTASVVGIYVWNAWQSIR